jgi:hypothetical protein
MYNYLVIQRWTCHIQLLQNCVGLLALRNIKKVVMTI